MKCVAALLIGAMVAPAGGQPSDDSAYLRTVAADTWHCISGLVEPASGFPYDNSDKSEFTSVSNVGIYLTSIVCADRFGFISHKDAIERARTTLANLERLRTWFGFQQCWNGVKTLKIGTNDRWISLLDSGNLCAGLVTVSQAYPEVRDQAQGLFTRHRWKAFYDEGQRALLGGYNTETGQFNMKWHLDALGTDAALAQFFAVGTGAAPSEFWRKLNRRQVTWEGESFLWPGWDGGGLFMQFISGLWVDLRGTELGKSGAAFARAQLHHADTVKSPVWGWSACSDPGGGYLGWGALRDEVVTPHACVLAIDQMPGQVVANLHELEKIGARSPREGFYDSVNWKTGKVAKRFLLLDQGMVLISLTNALDKGSIRRFFGQSTVAKIGMGRIRQ